MKRAAVIPVGAAAIAALCYASAVNPAPILVWNASASAPIGLYLLRAGSPEIGDYVLVESDRSVRKFIECRAHLPDGIPLLKRVAAVPGAEICRLQLRVLIDGVVVAYALEADSLGRPMPQWRGCIALKRDEVFLLNDHEKSLDGRYFGGVSVRNIVGVATPLWTFSEDGRRDEK
ncbi:MAG: S26 family signal peptidase [Parvularculaceae bacterium]